MYAFSRLRIRDNINENDEDDVLIMFRFVMFQTKKQIECCIARLMNNNASFFTFI